MEEKFNDDFLEINTGDSKNNNKQNRSFSNKKEYLIDIDKIDQSNYRGVCHVMFANYNNCKTKNESMSQKEICDKARDNLLQCLNESGKFISTK